MAIVVPDLPDAVKTDEFKRTKLKKRAQKEM